MRRALAGLAPHLLFNRRLRRRSWARRRRILELRERLALLGAVILELEDTLRQGRSDRLACLRALRGSPEEGPPAPQRKEGLGRALAEVDDSLGDTEVTQRRAMAARSVLSHELERLVEQEQAWANALAFRSERALRRRAAVVGFAAGVAVTVNAGSLLWSVPELPPPEPAVALEPAVLEPVLDEPQLDEDDVFVFEVGEADVIVLPRILAGANSTE